MEKDKDMRTIKELVTVLRDYIDRKDWADAGICASTLSMLKENMMSAHEDDLLDDWLHDNLPTPTWPNEPGYDQYDTNDGLVRLAFCWKIGDRMSRVEWLDEKLNTMS